MAEFAERVYEVVRQVPKGCVATYGQVAALMGSPRSARYVGFALRSNPHPGTGEGSVPCHRVVFKDGSVCKGFAFGGPEVQKALLEAEGVTFCDDDHVDMQAHLWDGCGCDGFAADGEMPTEIPPEVLAEKLQDEQAGVADDE